MRFFAAALLIFLARLLPVMPAAALGAEKPWFGGIYAGFCGFSETTGLPAAEYLSLGLFAEPLSIHVLNPALSGGVLLPVSPAGSEALRFLIAVDLTLVDLPGEFLTRRFYISSRWSPAVGAECLLTPDFRSARFAVLLAPLRSRTGDALFTVAAVRLLADEAGSLQGWGVTLFEASLFLF